MRFSFCSSTSSFSLPFNSSNASRPSISSLPGRRLAHILASGLTGAWAERIKSLLQLFAYCVYASIAVEVAEIYTKSIYLSSHQRPAFSPPCSWNLPKPPVVSLFFVEIFVWLIDSIIIPEVEQVNRSKPNFRGVIIFYFSSSSFPIARGTNLCDPYLISKP